MSELSTVAIKDGHRGHPHHHTHRQQASTSDNPEAERADRISRLAGLERVATVRQASAASAQAGAHPASQQGYFETPNAAANLAKERSTVGSASATGSVGGRTTWASGSNAEDATDKMSEDQDMDTSSAGGFSDEGNGSLVGFGEGAGSTVSGPISTPSRASQRYSRGSGLVTPQIREPPGAQPMVGVTPTRQDSRMNVDQDTSDTARSGEGAETAERIMRDRSFTASDDMSMGQHDGQGQQLGKFNFE